MKNRYSKEKHAHVFAYTMVLLFVNFVGIISTLLEDYCELSNHFMQEVVLDRKLGIDTSKELEKKRQAWGGEG